VAPRAAHRRTHEKPFEKPGPLKGPAEDSARAVPVLEQPRGQVALPGTAAGRLTRPAAGEVTSHTRATFTRLTRRRGRYWSFR